MTTRVGSQVQVIFPKYSSSYIYGTWFIVLLPCKVLFIRFFCLFSLFPILLMVALIPNSKRVFPLFVRGTNLYNCMKALPFGYVHVFSLILKKTYHVYCCACAFWLTKHWSIFFVIGKSIILLTWTYVIVLHI